MAAGVINVPAQLSGSRMTDAALQGNSRMLPIGRAQKETEQIPEKRVMDNFFSTFS